MTLCLLKNQACTLSTFLSIGCWISLVHAATASSISPPLGSHHVQRLSFARLSDPIGSASNLALLSLLPGRLHGCRLSSSACVHDLHLAIVDLREVVVFDGAGCCGRFAVDHGCRSQVPTELIRVERCADEGPTLAEQLLQILRRDDPRVDTSDLQLALGESALDLHYVGVLILDLDLRPLLIPGSDYRSPRLSPTQRGLVRADLDALRFKSQAQQIRLTFCAGAAGGALLPSWRRRLSLCLTVVFYGFT